MLQGDTLIDQIWITATTVFMGKSSQVQPKGVGNGLLTGFQLYDAVVRNYSETLHMQGFAEQLGSVLWYEGRSAHC